MMKKQLLMKQVCGLSIIVAGALLPLSSSQATGELSDRYLNGYLNDPYTNEVAPEKKSVMPRGAEGPIRTEPSSAKDVPSGTELYNPPDTNRVAPQTRNPMPHGAQGPIRNEVSSADPRSMKQRHNRYESGELFEPYVEISSDKGMWQNSGKNDSTRFP